MLYGNAVNNGYLNCENSTQTCLVSGRRRRGLLQKNKIYSSYESNSYKEVSFVTDDYIHDMPETMDICYVGLVDEYLGEMTPKPNVIQTLLSKIY